MNHWVCRPPRGPSEVHFSPRLVPPVFPLLVFPVFFRLFTWAWRRVLGVKSIRIEWLRSVSVDSSINRSLGAYTYQGTALTFTYLLSSLRCFSRLFAWNLGKSKRTGEVCSRCSGVLRLFIRGWRRIEMNRRSLLQVFRCSLAVHSGVEENQIRISRRFVSYSFLQWMRTPHRGQPDATA